MVGLWFLLSLSVVVSVESAEVYVDSNAGNDTVCLSLQDLGNSSNLVSCKTINKALGEVGCNSSCENNQPLHDSVVKLSDGVHILQDCIAILQGENVTVVAENTGMATIKCTNFGNTEVWDNIVSCQTRGLAFKGIHFEGCGPLSSNVFINRSTDVLFEDCSFRENIGAPLRLQFVPVVSLIRTNFINNRNEILAPEDDESTIVSQLFNSITTSGGFTYYNLNGNVSIRIDHCQFIGNRANVNRASDTRPMLLKANGHGGAVAIRLAGIGNGVISVTNSLFDSNEAEVDGGGIYFSLSDGFSSNSVHLCNNTFTSNRVLESSGGAISWIVFSYSFNNSLIVEDCIFTNNSGNAGGAVSISLHGTSLDSFLLPDKAHFIHSLFSSNVGKIEGSAVGLFALLHVEEFGFPVEFTDCNFTANRNEDVARIDSLLTNDLVHSSALLAFRFPVTLSGCNHFEENIGGGITLMNARLNVRGELLFLNNLAMFGGGIAMDDSCLLEVFPDVNIVFMNNNATVSGGGIHVTFPAIRHTTSIFNRLCFFQYDTLSGTTAPLYEWQNVNITFVGNQAGQSGAAIYASDMLLCSWIANNYTEGNIFSDQLPSWSPFHYDDNVVLGTARQENVNLATSPHRIHVVPMLQSKITQPGETVLLNILCTDQLNNYREAVWMMQAQDEEILDGISAGNMSFQYDVPQARQLVEERIYTCSENTSGIVSLNFSLPNTLGETTAISLKFSGCHPGYNMNPITCTCQCSSADSKIIRCDQENRYVYLRSGLWGDTTISAGNRQLVTARPPAYFLSCNREGRLPGCLFQFDNISAQCRAGRRGALCGTCNKGYAVTLELQTCLEAKDGCILGLSLFIIYCILTVVVSFLVLFFDIGLPNGLKGVFFYAQVIGLVYRPHFVRESNSDSDNADVLAVLTNIMGSSVPIPQCISTTMGAHQVALLGYIPPILMLVTVFSYVMSVRFIKVLSNRSSLHGITLLSLLIYKHITDTSFTFISCSTTHTGWVFTYDGSVSCTSLELAFFVIIGLALVVLFAIPVPFGVSYICMKRPIRFQHYADVLTKGLHASRRWFGGWDIGRRLPFIFFGYISVRPSLVLFLMTIGALTVLLTHLLAQPYEKWHVNIIESLILANLLVVSIMYLNPPVSQIPDWFSTTLLLSPYIYGTLYVLNRFFRYLYRTYYKEQLESKKESFFMREKQITLGHKKVTIGGMGAFSVKLTDVVPKSGEATDTNPVENRNAALQEGKYTEREFCELRESLLEL